MLPNDPPLRARVRAFEAIARAGSISAAAKELMISPSAVSHQLKTLEAFLQMPLTERQGRHLVLRGEGGNITARSARRLTCCAGDRTRSRAVRVAAGHHQPDPAVRHGLVHSEAARLSARKSGYRHQCGLRQPPQLPERRRRSVDPLRGWAVDRLSQRKLMSGQMVPVCSRAFSKLHGLLDTPDQLATRCRCCMTRSVIPDAMVSAGRR